jgi:class 3 adenylate cyclase
MRLILNFLLNVVVFFIGIAGRLLAVYIAFFFLAFLVSLAPSVSRYPFLQSLQKIEKAIQRPAVSFLQYNFPTTYRGTEYAPWIFIGTIILVWFGVESQKARLSMKVRGLQQAWRDEAHRRALEQAAREAKTEVELSSDTIKSTIEKADRGKLLELYTQTKKSLESQKRSLAFLAVDVVNSTGMKVGEDPAVAERDFRQYKQLVEGAIQEQGSLKAAWTPDGVMICFPDAESAVKAAQDIITRLEPFNRTVKAMKSDFKVRAGINAGMVMFHESVPMEEMSSREIDIAGHLQKYAGENTIYITREAIQSAGGEFGFSPANREIDGRQVYEWKPGNHRGKTGLVGA